MADDTPRQPPTLPRSATRTSANSASLSSGNPQSLVEGKGGLAQPLEHRFAGLGAT